MSTRRVPGLQPPWRSSSSARAEALRLRRGQRSNCSSSGTISNSTMSVCREQAERARHRQSRSSQELDELGAEVERETAQQVVSR